MKKFLFFLGFFLLLPAMSAFADIPGVFCVGPGQCTPPAKGYATDQNNLTILAPMYWPYATYNALSAVAPIGPTSSPAQLYLVWGNSSGGATWTSAQQTVFVKIFSAIGTTGFWHWMGSVYPNNPDMGLAASWPDLQLSNCLSGSPAHCIARTYTSGSSVQNNTDDIHNNVIGTLLPLDANGIYVWLPAGTDTTGDSLNAGGNPSYYGIIGTRRGASGNVCGNTAPNQLWPANLYVNAHWNGGAGVGPNGDCGFDDIIYLFWFELMNLMPRWTFPNSAGGAGEEAEYFSYAHTAVNPAGNVYNFSVSDPACPSNGAGGNVCYALIQGGHYGAQGGGIWSDINAQYWNVPCQSDSDCPAWSHNCGSGVNLPPLLTGDTRLNHCITPQANDGRLNGYESDVDCGFGAGAGFNAGSFGCPDGAACATDVDCKNLTTSCCISNVCTAHAGVCP